MGTRDASEAITDQRPIITGQSHSNRPQLLSNAGQSPCNGRRDSGWLVASHAPVLQIRSWNQALRSA